ncbi:MAG TPA: hypothetical protein VIL39_11855 [Verrucomicrobiae bacterium]
MITITFNMLENANVPPAKAGTPCHLVSFAKLEEEVQQGMRFGVPPSGSQAHANTLTAKTCDALEKANNQPAKAGTPNRLAPYGVPALAGVAEIQQGMKELEGMLK